MKISCQSCQAKYTIADEKVRGKVVKIRCKKCGTTIVVNGNETSADTGAAPEQDDAPTRVFSYDHHASATDEWTVNVADGDQRSLTTAQLVDLHREGVVNDETYAWREGMDDWLPLGEIEALRSLLSSGAPAAGSAPPAPISAPAPAPAPTPAPAAPMFAAAAPSPGGAAARRPGARGGNADLFGGAAAAGGEDDVMTSASAKPQVATDHEKATGARNENSVLFSLSALTATAAASPSPAKSGGGDSSSIVDIKNLVAPGPSRPSPAKSGVDDIMNLGGGAIFSPSLAVPALAPPPTADLTSVPALADEPGASAGAAKKPGGKGAMLGIVGAVAVVAIGAGAFFAFGGKKDDGPKPVAETTTAAATATAPATAAATTTAPATAAATTTPAPADSAPAAVAANDKPEEKDKGPTEPAAVAPGSTPQRGSKTEKAEKPEKTAANEKSSTPSAAAVAAAAAGATPAPAATPAAPAADGAPFDRAAAMSALSSAASAASGCKKPDGPTGSGRVSVTFAPSGNATTANVEGPPFAGTSVGGCVAARFRAAHVPPFSGGTVTVHKSFSIN